MTTWATPYQSAYAPCSGRAQAGTIALSIVVKGLFPATTNLGIYNCRSVGDGETWSIHSDGRAWDCGIPMLPGGKPDRALGDPILHLLAAHAVPLGIQCVIWNDTIYSARHPDGDPYGGVSPHFDHIHIEQQWEEAQNLSVAEIAAILGGQPGGEGGGQPIPPPGIPAPPTPEGDADDMQLRPIRVSRTPEGDPRNLFDQVYMFAGDRLLHVTGQTSLNGLAATSILLWTEEALRVCTMAQFDAAVAQFKEWGLDVTCPCSEPDCRLDNQA